MKPHGFVALAALVASGCLGLPGRTDLAAIPSIEPHPSAPKVACASRVAPPPPGGLASAKSPAIGPGSDLPPVPVPPPASEGPPPAQAGPTIADRRESESNGPPLPKAADRPEPSVPEDPPSGIVEASDSPAPLEPATARAEVDVTPPPPPAIARAEVDVTPPSPPVVPARSGPSKPRGRPVASVGDEVISLPELTRATRARLDQLGPGVVPNRRQVIGIARETLKSMVVRSLVSQEALAKLDGPERLGELEARFGQTWADRELPALLRREGVATEGELRARLARRLTTPEALRDEFIVRSVAAELALLDRLDLDYDAYLDALRKRRPITSIMTPAELMAAGRQAAVDGPSAR